MTSGRKLSAICFSFLLAGIALPVLISASCANQSGEQINDLDERAVSEPAISSLPQDQPKTVPAAAPTVPATVPQPSAGAALSQVDTLLAGFSLERVISDIDELASDAYQGRKTGSAGADAAAAYISSRFSSLGLQPWSELGLSSYNQHFALGGVSDDNVIGVIAGSGAGYVIIAAHYDHLGVSADGRVFNGADDNAAGVAAVLEAARMIRGSGMKPVRTVVFCAFSGEEQGQFGSQALGSLIFSNGLADSVEMINIDGIGATGGSYFGVWDEGAANAGPLVSALKQAGNHLGIAVREEGTDIGSDAQPFDWQFGIPAVTVDWNWGQDESAFHPYYHTVNDDPEHISPDAISQASRVAIAGLWLRAQGTS